MKIPIIQATEPKGVVAPIYPGRVEREIGGLATESQRLIDTIVAQDQKIKEDKRKVQDALDYQTGIDDYRIRMSDYILDLDKDPNKTNYAERINRGSLEIQNDILGKIKTPNLQKSLKIKFSDLGSDYHIKAKIYENKWFESNKGAEVEEKLVNIEKAAGQATSDMERVKLGTEGIRLIDEVTGTIFNPEQASKRKIELSKNIEKESINFADVVADKAIEKNAKQAYIDLTDSNYLPNLLPKQRQDKSEKAWRASKVQENEQEQKTKEAEDLAIKKEDQEISDLYLAKKYTQVYARAQTSKILSGERKQHWGDAAEAAAQKTEKIDPMEETKEITYINGLIAKGVNPQVIQDSIIISPRLGEPAKKQLLNRLETHKNKELNRAASRSYEYMKKEIISPSGIAGVMAKVIPDDVKAGNYAKAQLALDDWIDNQILLEKPITGNDILTKAEELVKTFRPKLNQNSPIIQKKNQDLIKGLGELGEMSKGKTTEVPPVITKPKQIKYKNIEEVKNAYNRKELTYGEAEEILKRDFGVK